MARRWIFWGIGTIVAVSIAICGLAGVVLCETALRPARRPVAPNPSNQMLEIQPRVLGPEHIGTLGFMRDLANAYDKEGKHAQTDALYTKTLEIPRRLLGSGAPRDP